MFEKVDSRRIAKKILYIGSVLILITQYLQFNTARVNAHMYEEKIFLAENIAAEGPDTIISVDPFGGNYNSYGSQVSSDINLSPDGSKIIYYDDNYPNELVVASADSGSILYTTNYPNVVSKRAPKWSPDGSRILFSGHNVFSGVSGVYVMNADGSSMTLLMSNADTANWAPDSFRFVYSDSTDANQKRISLGNLNSEVLDTFGMVDENWYQPVWSPDGLKIAWNANYYDYNGNTVSDLRIMDISGGNQQVVVSTIDSETVQNPAEPQWSPDSTKIVFLAFADNTSPYQSAWIVSATGGQAVMLRDSIVNVLQWWSPSGQQPITTTIEVNNDSYIRSGQSNRNHGADTEINIQSSGNNRGLIKFNQSAIESAVGGGTVLSATLKLNITDNGNNWGSTGRTLDIHRLIKDWAEGNGTINNRGAGMGATWDCAVDSVIENQSKNCSGVSEWEMGQPNNPTVHPWTQTASATQTIVNNQTGIVEFDVTADIVAFMNGIDNFGWLIKKTNEGQNGQVTFGTKESGFGAEIVITYLP